MQHQVSEQFHVFLSHTSEDKTTFIDPICERFHNDFQLKAFYDKSNLPLGGDFRERILSAMEMSSCVAFFYSSSKPKEFFNSEIGMAAALEKQFGESDGFVIPVLLPGADKKSLHDLHLGRTWLDLSNGIEVRDEDRGTKLDPLWPLAQAIKQAVVKQAARIAHRVATHASSRVAKEPFVPQDLLILCDRGKQSAVVENEIDRFRQSELHRPILAVVRGPEKQLPRAFVDRVLYDTLPGISGLKVFPKKIVHDIVVASSGTAGQTTGAEMQQMTRNLVRGCESAGIDISGDRSLADILQCLTAKRCAFVVQVRVKGPETMSEEELLQLVYGFYSQREFAVFDQPLVACLLMLDGEAEEGSKASFFTWIMHLFRPRKKSNPKSLEEYQRSLSIVHPPNLGDVDDHDVADWTEHPRVKAFNPEIAYCNFGVVLQNWENQFGKHAAPMADAVEDLKDFLAKSLVLE